MRTSLNNIKLIDEHLFNAGTIEDALLFDALLIIDPELKDQVADQQRAHDLVTHYSRRQIKQEIASVHNQLFHTTMYNKFRQSVLNLFR